MLNNDGTLTFIVIFIVVAVLLVIGLGLCCRICAKEALKRDNTLSNNNQSPAPAPATTTHRRMFRHGQIVLSNQQEDVYNISARVQGQGAWPTHEGHVSLDHFAIANETNKYGDAPPSYEEAVRIAPHPVLEANPSSLISVTTVPKPAATPPPASTH